MKVSKESVDYEHPAAKSDHCGICRYFNPPRRCDIVAGLIRAEDWCKRFVKTASRALYPAILVGILIYELSPSFLSVALAVNANPAPGSVWTWFGPTIGADWAAALAANCANITSFGGAGDNSTDNTKALTAALKAATTPANNAVCVAFPPGKFLFSSPFTYNYPPTVYASLTFIGAGQDVTEIVSSVTNNNLFIFNAASLATNIAQGYQSIHIWNMSFETPTAGLGTAITLNGSSTLNINPGYAAQSDFKNVSFYGTDRTNGSTGGNVPKGTNYWLHGITINSWSEIVFDNVYMQGIDPIAASGQQPTDPTGVKLTGTSNNPADQYLFVNSTFNLLGTGIQINNNIQGVTITNSSFVGNIIGINWAGLVGAVLAVSNSAFNCNTDVFVNGQLAVMTFTGNTFYVGPFGGSGPANFAGINIAGSSIIELTVMGNIFNGVGPNVTGSELLINADVNAGAVVGNAFTNYGNSGGNMVGITLGANSRAVHVGTNTYIGLQTNITNGGPTNVIDNHTYGNTPTVTAGAGACGTAPALATQSNDLRGLVLVGTGTNGGVCPITFGNGFVINYGCFVNNNTSTARPVYVQTISNTGFTIASANTLNPGDALSYKCEGYQ